MQQQRPPSQPGHPAAAAHHQPQLHQQSLMSLPQLPIPTPGGSTHPAASFSMASSHPLAQPTTSLLPMSQQLLYHHSQQQLPSLQSLQAMQPMQSLQSMTMQPFPPSNVTQSAPISYGGAGQQLVMSPQYMYSQFSAPPLPQPHMQRPLMQLSATPANPYSTTSSPASSTAAPSLTSPMPLTLAPNAPQSISPYSLLPSASPTDRAAAHAAVAAASAAAQLKLPRSKDKIKHSKSETRRRTRLRMQFTRLREVTRTDKKDRFSILQAAVDRIEALEARMDERDQSGQDKAESTSGVSRKKRDKKRHRGRGEEQQAEVQQADEQEEETEEAVMKREEDDMRQREERAEVESSPVLMPPPSSSPVASISTSLLTTLSSIATTSTSSPASPGQSASTCSSPVSSSMSSSSPIASSPPSLNQPPV